MAKALTEFDIEVDGETYHVAVRSMDIVRLEEQFETTISHFDASMKDLFRMAYVVLRHRKEDVPDTFEAFLELEPDIDMSSVTGNENDEEGKDSRKAPSTS